MNRSPAFQLYPDKAIAGSDHLTDKSFKAYWRTIWWMWMNSDDYCSMPNTTTAWRRASGIQSAAKLRKVLEELLDPECPMFKVEDDRIVCGGTRKEAMKQGAKRTQAAEAAKKRWHRDAPPEQCEMHAVASSTQCTPSPSPSPSPIPTPSVEKTKRFVPPTVEEVRAYADEIGYPQLNADGFVASYEQKDWKVGKVKMKDWKAAVRNWKANGWGQDAAPTASSSDTHSKFN